MLVHFGIDLLRAEWERADVCVGTFDGVHLGHRQVILTALENAKQSSKPCVLVTFDRHPASVLAPDRKPAAIATLGQNMEQFRHLGVPVCIVLKFDQHLAMVEAEQFLGEVLVGAIKADEIVIGHDFAMGRGRVGDAAWLSQRIKTTVVPPFQIEGQRVSSSEVRRSISSGDVVTAGALLGRPWALEGVVVKGQQIGRTLGYPTINIARSAEQVMPAHGIYGGTCRTPLGAFKAAVSIGVRPAVGGSARTIEAFLLDFPGTDIYGANVELRFYTRMREERDFPDIEALKAQISEDVSQVVRTVPSPST